MMEKTIPNIELKKTSLTEEMKKYQKYTGQREVEIQNESAQKENSEAVVRRPRKTIQKIRPKSEVREKEVWIDGNRRRPLSYIEGTKEKDFLIHTTKKPVAPSLPRPLLSGLVWQQGSGLFARWKEVFLILNKDCVRCPKISSAKSSQFGSLVFSLDLVLVSDVRYVERRGYLTLVMEGQGMARTYFRRTDGIKEWGRTIQVNNKSVLFIGH